MNQYNRLVFAADSARKFFRRKRQEYDFNKLAERELFLFAILLNRRELGKMMWKTGQDQLGKKTEKLSHVASSSFNCDFWPWPTEDWI